MLHFTIKQMFQTTIGLMLTAFIGLFLATDMQLEKTKVEIENETTRAKEMSAIKDTRFYVVQIQQFLTDVGATRNAEAKAEADDSLDGANQSLDKLAAIAPELASEIQQLRVQVSKVHAIGVEMGNAYIQDGTEAGNLIMKREGGFDDLALELATKLGAVADGIESEMTQAMLQASDSADRTGRIVLLTSIGIIVFMAVVMALLYRKVLLSMIKLHQSMQNAASGAKDLTARLYDKGNDEVSQLAGSFNQFVETIRVLIDGFAVDAGQLDASSKQMAQAANNTLSGMERLKGETEQVATAMTEMQATVQEVAGNAEQASLAAQDSNKEAKQGEEIVKKTIESIESLAGGVERAAQALQKVEGDTNSIGTILDVIRGIADQTNLLALNAAIEAARAGEQGRGFAVVADEVRSLAQRTQESTEEIQSMISQLQIGARDAVTVMSESRQQADASKLQAAEAGEALGRITQSVATIAEMATQIATAAEEQTAVANDINRNISNISSESNQTEENARQSDEVSGQVNQLVSQISNKLGEFKT